MNFVASKILPILTKWCLNFLGGGTNILHQPDACALKKPYRFKTTQDEPNSKEERVECAVCLSPIEGDEIKELRCEHLFHKVCIERWVGYGGGTCPSCRCWMKSCIERNEVGENVIFFSFCSSGFRDHKDSWWLRWFKKFLWYVLLLYDWIN